MGESQGNSGGPVPTAAGPGAPDSAARAERLAEKVAGATADLRARLFQEKLVKLAPRVWITPAIVILNAAVFVAMVAGGVHVLEPKVSDLIAWQADYGPKTLAGEWWRLLTSAFIHIGILHIIFNMYAFISLGPLVERLFGKLSFGAIYLISALSASLASVWWSPMVTSAGASGAIFGVYGALLGYLLTCRRTVPSEILLKLGRGTIAFIGYNLVYGALMPNIDCAAHVGGLAAGLALGLALARPLEEEVRRRAWMRALPVTAAFLAVLALAAGAMPKGVAGLDEALSRFSEAEHKAVEAHNLQISWLKSEQITEEKLADGLEQNVLPRWREAEATLAGVTDLPGSIAPRIGRIKEYAALKRESVELLIKGIREKDGAAIWSAKSKQERAAAILRELNPGE